jgi:hypothetical protein
MQRQTIYDVRKFAKVATTDLPVYEGAAVSLLIFSNLIFEPNVDPGIPSLAAARDGPDTEPSLSANAASGRNAADKCRLAADAGWQHTAHSG